MALILLFGAGGTSPQRADPTWKPAFHHRRLISTSEINVDQVVAAFGAAYAEVSPDGEEHYEKPDLCNTIVVDFLAADPVATIAPMRRVQSGP